MNFTQQEKAAVLLVILAVVVGAGILGMRRGAAPVTLGGSDISTAVQGSQSVKAGPATQQPPSTVQGRPAHSSTVTGVVVHIGGAVVRPGVYTLPNGSRLVDAVKAAGGGIGSADLDSLNLAAPVADGQKIEVPEFGAPSTPEGPVSSNASTRAVNINSASASELDALPGVGPALAKRIEDYRAANGPFGSISDLDKVPGIGPKMVARLGEAAVVR